MSGTTSDTADAGPQKPAGDGVHKGEARRNLDDLPPAAQRALKEAEERRRQQDAKAEPAREIGGRGGKDPSRYGDWEIDGRAVDF